MELLHYLAGLPVRVRLTGPSAVYYYLYRSLPRVVTIAIQGDLVDIARCFDSPQYTPVDSIDARVFSGDSELLVTCLDAFPDYADSDLLAWQYDPGSKRFLDYTGVYPRLRAGTLRGDPDSSTALLYRIFATAQLPVQYEPGLSRQLQSQSALPPGLIGSQQLLLSGILAGTHAADALAQLHHLGWLAELFPELALLDTTEQGKSEHPEGNVWQHSLEALRYRKSSDLRVGLAVLMHDIGKPHAERTAEHRFHLHADIGARLAQRLLRQYGFPEPVVQDTAWLIRYHSIPGALERLPPHRSTPLMSSPLFPLLLELYRCDLSATFRGPDGYYRACTVYRRFLKHNANPFRDSGGKKLVNQLVE